MCTSQVHVCEVVGIDNFVQHTEPLWPCALHAGISPSRSRT